MADVLLPGLSATTLIAEKGCCVNYLPSSLQYQIGCVPAMRCSDWKLASYLLRMKMGVTNPADDDSKRSFALLPWIASKRVGC